jgi:hypothetical protein
MSSRGGGVVLLFERGSRSRQVQPVQVQVRSAEGREWKESRALNVC